MAGDDDFEAQLGHGGGDRRADRALGRTLAATRRAGGSGTRAAGRFHGSRTGRGASLGRMLAGRPTARRRVVVKARIVRLAGKGLGAARAHVRYLRRDGVTREGAPGELYDADRDRADGAGFLARGQDDRHQFRFIVSAEDGDRYSDLKPLVRRLMDQMAEDLGTKLDWVAVDHFNTGHPHSHVVVRGVDERGRDLVIARDYIGHGLRARAEELVTLDLGPATRLEIETRRRHDITAERVTPLDRTLIAASDAEHRLSAAHPDPVENSLRTARLRKLETLGLAQTDGAGRWRLDEALAIRLAAIAERADRLGLLERSLREAGRDRAPDRRSLYDPQDGSGGAFVGRVVRQGLGNEHRDRRYLIVDGIDGHARFVDVGEAGPHPLPAEGAVVAITPRPIAARAVDRTVAEVAARNQGRYSIDLHLRHDPQASEEFAQAHVRRLEAMRRATGGVTRELDGSWRIAPDHVERARAFEATRARGEPVTIRLLSDQAIERLTASDAPTWIDRTLAGALPLTARDEGFGQEVRAAQRQRQAWLVAQGLAERDGEALLYRPDMLEQLRRRELLRVAGEIADELKRDFVEARPGMRVEGRLVRMVPLAGGEVALIERARDFTLVPWRPAMERQLGRQVAGIARESGISFSVLRSRPGPEID